jgi:signal transduction histidine kinase
VAGQIFPRLWGNVLSWVLPAGNTGAVQIAAKIEESGDVRITFDDPAHWQQVGSYLLRVAGSAGERRLIIVELSREPGAFNFTVANRGEPIKPQIINQIFEPHFSTIEGNIF